MLNGLVGPIIMFVALGGVDADVNSFSPRALFVEKCGQCHGPERLGGIGPALIPENLGRLKKAQAIEIIKVGRAATQMPPFGEMLTEPQIASLAELIYSPLENIPVWDRAQIEASRIEHADQASLPNEPVFKADLQNLFLVVETGDHHVTLLNGDTFEPIHRFPSRFALHGGPKYTRDGRFVFFASRDGWISKFDIYNLTMVAEVRAGINTRNAAVSFDGKYVAVGNYLPHTVTILNASDLSLAAVIPVENPGGQSSRVSAVYTAPPRGSFVVALKDIPEVWEIPYRQGIGSGKAPTLRKMAVDHYLDDFFFDMDYKHVIGAARPGPNMPNDASGQVVDLDLGKRVAGLDLAGMPHLGSGITWKYGDSRVLATPNLKDGRVSIIDMKDWQPIKEIETLGPGFFMRSHEKSPYAWVDVFFGPHRDKVHVIDKKTLEIVKTLQPEPGKTAAHVEFTKDGRYVLLSIWEMDGAVIVYDAHTLEEVKRIPMKKPSGKYNVYNKTHYEEGTSH